MGDYWRINITDLFQQRQHALRNLVGLCHHGRARLLQDLRAGKVGSFGRKVRILNATSGRRHVLRRSVQVGNRSLKARLQRANYGALQSRFETTVNNLQGTSENMSAARSRIQDADFAAETANLSRSQILQQAGTAMVAQANQLPQGVLALLRG